MNLETLEKLFDFIDQSLHVHELRTKVLKLGIVAVAMGLNQDLEEEEARLLTRANELRRLASDYEIDTARPK